MLNAFEPGDLRKAKWLNSTVIGGQIYFYPFKYKIRSGRPVTEYYMVLRLAEQYLIRAEAEAKLNDLSDAIADLNIVRSRAGLPNTSATTQAQLLAAIKHERQVELFCEWGSRWFDLKRTGDIDAVLGAEKTGWSSTDSLYPIPFSEIQANPFLTQNTGY